MALFKHGAICSSRACEHSIPLKSSRAELHKPQAGGLDLVSLWIYLPDECLSTVRYPPYPKDRNSLSSFDCPDFPSHGFLAHRADNATAQSIPILWMGRPSHGSQVKHSDAVPNKVCIPGMWLECHCPRLCFG